MITFTSPRPTERPWIARRPWVALAVLSLLSACAADQSLSDRLAGAGRVKGDRETVSVFGMGSRVDALPLAIGHCARYGRSAQFSMRRGESYVFTCVAS